jgi:AraC-like DNA-binding protein
VVLKFEGVAKSTCPVARFAKGISCETGELERSCLHFLSVLQTTISTAMKTPGPRNQVRYIRHVALPAVEVMIADPSTGGWRMFHDRYLICGCTSVATAWVYRGKTRHIEDGATGFMEPGETHRVVAKHKPSHFQAVFIDPERFTKLAEEAGLATAPHFRVMQVMNPEIIAEVTRLTRYLQSGEKPLQLQTQLAILVQKALTYGERKPVEFKSWKQGLAKPLNQAKEFLESHVHETVTLQQLAAVSAMSRFHLVRSFTQQFGIPPHAYLLQARVKKARALLRSGMPGVEVAPAVGFADQSHFTRHFKKIMGVTPSEYAREENLISVR